MGLESHVDVLESVEDFSPPDDGVRGVTEQGLPNEEVFTEAAVQLWLLDEGVPKFTEEGVPNVPSLNKKLSDSDSKLNGKVCFNQAEK